LVVALDRSFVLAIGLSLAMLTGCGAGAESTAAGRGAEAPKSVGNEEHGGASYYADRFQGKPTASGEPYDRAALTAAHKTLPFGAIVKVIRISDGRSVEVRINDRGPHTKGRIIDLSRQAAEELGIIRAGVAEVRLVVVSMPPEKKKKKKKARR
jgi:rare lipoprotein A